MSNGTVILNGTSSSLSQTFSIVISGMVSNVIVATGNFLNNLTSTFDYAVAYTSVIGYSYDSSANTFSPPAPPLPSLSDAIAENIATFEVSMQAFIDESYSIDTRMNFIGMYINAQLNSLTNRMAYIAPLLVWQNSCIAYAASYIATVSAMTDVNTVLSTLPDFSSLISSNPNLTPAAALEIND